MTALTKDNLNKCVSLLTEFIEEARISGMKTGTAQLALEQLKRISAGGTTTQSWCYARPRAETTPGTGTE